MIEVELLDDKCMPIAATEGSAAYDLFARIPEEGYVKGTCIFPGSTLLIPAGFKMALPAALVGMVCPRSGLALKFGITVLNAPGIIDSDYRGEVGVVLHNASNEVYRVDPYARIAQLVIMPKMYAPMQKVEGLSTTTQRGEGGFGSTGK